ncbi:MAG: hypothetical protein IJL32_11195 [Oscillospiraceae bacterium]|nr:hypothetical protein [Oscillospiraceae bacterium]
MMILLTILIWAAVGTSAGAGLCLLAVKGFPSLNADMSMMKYFLLWGLAAGLIFAVYRIALRIKRSKQMGILLMRNDAADAGAGQRMTNAIAKAELVAKTARANADGSDSLTPFPESGAQASAQMKQILSVLADNAAKRSALELLCEDLAGYEQTTGGDAE